MTLAWHLDALSAGLSEIAHVGPGFLRTLFDGLNRFSASIISKGKERFVAWIDRRRRYTVYA